MHPPLPPPAEIAKLPPDGGPDFNRLIFEPSPYLLQHARNPVDWYPWSPAAFERARAENKPIFLSVGYSTCHWCHVMERESFENEAVAAILNDRYVAIKVDREERPDLDDIYMTATQLMTQRGGWPNSLWLTPDGRPWYAGTYFPPEDRHGRPGFSTVLRKLSEVWTQQQAKALEQADALAAEMHKIGAGEHAAAEGELSRQVVADALAELPASFDRRRGGFGNAPKFPPHGALALLLYTLTRDDDPARREMLTKTLDAMALGGIHDHIGGGFHRYSTDGDWFLPHFEKMLYDNAQLLHAYTAAAALTGDAAYAAAARDTGDWVLREMTGPQGGFFSALDADSEGEEGKCYLWTPAEIAAVLGPDDGALFCRVYNVEPDGNYREEASGHATGASIAHLQRSLAANAQIEAQTPAAFLEQLSACRAQLLTARNRRVPPHLDDKVLTSWNGLMLGALAVAGKTLPEPRYLVAAQKAADFLLATHRRPDGTLLRTSREGVASLPGYLEDYAFLAWGLLDLATAAGEPRYLAAARDLAERMVAQFYDPATGGFYFTAAGGEKLLLRQKDAFDQAIPSGNGMAVRLLVRLAALRDTPPAQAAQYRAMARQTLAHFLGSMQKLPRGTECLLLATAEFFDTAPAGDAAPAPVAALPVLGTAQAHRSELAVIATAVPAILSPGARFTLAVELAVAAGCHLYDRLPQSAPGLPTEIALAETLRLPPPPSAPAGTPPATVHVAQPATVENVRWPEPRTESIGGEPVRVYAGTVTVQLDCRIHPACPSGPTSVVLRIRAQPCTAEVCRPPVDFTLAVPLEIRAE